MVEAEAEAAVGEAGGLGGQVEGLEAGGAVEGPQLLGVEGAQLVQLLELVEGELAHVLPQQVEALVLAVDVWRHYGRRGVHFARFVIS